MHILHYIPRKITSGLRIDVVTAVNVITTVLCVWRRVDSTELPKSQTNLLPLSLENHLLHFPTKVCTCLETKGYRSQQNKALLWFVITFPNYLAHVTVSSSNMYESHKFFKFSDKINFIHACLRKIDLDVQQSNR